jgi:hypothetical protein
MNHETFEVMQLMLTNLINKNSLLTPTSKTRELIEYGDCVLHFKKVFSVFSNKVNSDCDKIIEKIYKDSNKNGCE